jgi:hypothetical protein
MPTALFAHPTAPQKSGLRKFMHQKLSYFDLKK